MLLLAYVIKWLGHACRLYCLTECWKQELSVNEQVILLYLTIWNETKIYHVYHYTCVGVRGDRRAFIKKLSHRK